jgi:hypothetical protein
MIRSMTLIIAAVVFLFAGCQVPAPTKDTTPPEVTVTVSRAHGRNIFRSIDGVQGKGNDCIIVRDMPTQLILIAGDAGGVASTSLRAFTGRIVPESLEVSPRPPEGSSSIRSEAVGDTLTITLTPPSPTTVRTGATAVLEVNGPLPISIYAWVTDRAGHYVELPPFTLDSPANGVQCRGSV